MNTEELTQQFKNLLTVNPPNTEIARLFHVAVNSRVLNFESEEADSYRTAKIIYHVILCKMAEQWKPLDPANKREAEKLKSHLS